MEKGRGRRLKSEVLSLLKLESYGASLHSIGKLPPRQVVNPLFSFLYHADPLVRWRAVSAMGEVVSRLADRDMESARVVMRRFMWSLNDESGGIGWGSPESMGEITRRHHRLADEYGRLLESYIREDENYLEHPDLQAGVLWGLSRLAHARPHLVQTAAPHLKPFLSSGLSTLRGLGAWTAEALPHASLLADIARLLHDDSPIRIYMDGEFVDTQIRQLAARAKERIQNQTESPAVADLANPV